MKDDGWFIWILEQQLVQDVENDGEDDEGEYASDDEKTSAAVGELLEQRSSESFEETHDGE